MKHNDSTPLSGPCVYEAPDLRTYPLRPEEGYAVSGSLENVTEEGTETQW